MDKMRAIFGLLKAGEEVSNAAAWTNRTIIFNLLLAVLGLAAAFGFKVDLDADTVTALAGGIVAAVTAVNAVVHAATDARVGLPVQPQRGTDADAGGGGNPPDVNDINGG